MNQDQATLVHGYVLRKQWVQLRGEIAHVYASLGGKRRCDYKLVNMVQVKKHRKANCRGLEGCVHPVNLHRPAAAGPPAAGLQAGEGRAVVAWAA